MSESTWKDICTVCDWLIAQREKQSDITGKQALLQVEMQHVQRVHPQRGFKNS